MPARVAPIVRPFAHSGMALGGQNQFITEARRHVIPTPLSRPTTGGRDKARNFAKRLHSKRGLAVSSVRKIPRLAAHGVGMTCLRASVVNIKRRPGYSSLEYQPVVLA